LRNVSFFRKEASCYPATSARRLENQTSITDRAGLDAIFETVAGGAAGGSPYDLYWVRRFDVLMSPYIGERYTCVLKVLDFVPV